MGNSEVGNPDIYHICGAFAAHLRRICGAAVSPPITSLATFKGIFDYGIQFQNHICGAFAAHSRRVRGAFAARSQRVRGAFAARLRRVCGVFAARSRRVRGAFAAHSRRDRGAFAARSNKEGPVTYRGDVPLALFKNTEMVLPVLLLQVALLMI